MTPNIKNLLNKLFALAPYIVLLLSSYGKSATPVRNCLAKFWKAALVIKVLVSDLVDLELNSDNAILSWLSHPCR